MNVIQGVLAETINQMHHWLYYSGPKMLAAIIVLVAGWLIAKIVRSGSVKLMKTVRLDAVAQKTGVDEFLARGT